MSLARLQNKALAKQIGEVKAVSKLFQKHFAVAENISFASSCQRNFKIVLQYLDKENIFLSLELEIVSSILRGERNLLWMREATKVNEKLLTNNIFLQLANHVWFFFFGGSEEKPCKTTQHSNENVLPKRMRVPDMCAQNKTVFTFQKSKRILILRAEECLVSKKSKLQHISQRLFASCQFSRKTF